MPHASTEDELVEQPAIGLFEDLGWETVSAAEEIFGTNPQPSPLTSSISASLRFPKGEGLSLGRTTKMEAVLAGCHG